MRLVDSHCHLQSPRYDDDREAVIERALEVLEWVVVIGDDLPTSEAAFELARPRVFATSGIHPYYAATIDEDGVLDGIEKLLASEYAVALGEIGLDYYNEYAPRDVQRRAFEAQLEVAARREKPVVIHNRDADADTLAVLAGAPDGIPAVIMHCFGSSAETARVCADRGYYVSFAGNVTFSKAQQLRDAAAVVPIDRLLVETDAPFLAPVPLRGQRCEPGFVQHTGAFVAELRGTEFDAFAEQTTANAHRVYGVPV